MSYTELHVGIIREIPLKGNGDLIENFCKEQCELRDLTLSSKHWYKYNSYYERLFDYYNEKFGHYLIKNKDNMRLFIAEDNEYDDYESDLITKNSLREDAYPYVLYFDNGGTTAIDELEFLINEKICKPADN